MNARHVGGTAAQLCDVVGYYFCALPSIYNTAAGLKQLLAMNKVCKGLFAKYPLSYSDGRKRK